MFKGLISRILGSPSVRSGLPLNSITAASERKTPQTVPPSSAPRRPSQRKDGKTDQDEPVNPADLLHGIATLQQRYRKDLEYYKNNETIVDDPSERDVSAHIECIRKITGYTFKDPDLVRGAIFHGHTSYKGKILTRATQLQLAKLGDELFRSIHYSTNFPSTEIGTEYEGRAWAWLTSNATLHFAAQRVGLPEMLAESGYASAITVDGDKGFGTLVEALVGAVYIDSGEDGAVTRTTMAKMLGTSMEREELEQFFKTFRTQVSLPVQRTQFHTIRSRAKVREQHKEESATSDANVESRLQAWASEVKILKKVSRRRVKSVSRRMQKRRGAQLSGPSLKKHIEAVKTRAARVASRVRRKSKGSHAGARKKLAKRERLDSMLEWIEQAEERLKQGQDFHKHGDS